MARKKTRAVKHKYGYLEFINFRGSESQRVSERASERVESGDSPWSGSHTMEDAVKIANFGFDYSSGEIDNSAGNLTRLNSRAMETAHEVLDVAGGYVDIGEYLDGEPECMWNTYVDEERSPVRTVYIESAVNAEVDGSQLVNFAQKVAAAMDAAQALGVYIEIIVVVRVTLPAGIRQLEITVKRPEERVNSNSIVGAFHPVFLRRFYFNWLEWHKHLWDGSYGQVNELGPEHVDAGVILGYNKHKSLSAQEIFEHITK